MKYKLFYFVILQCEQSEVELMYALLCCSTGITQNCNLVQDVSTFYFPPMKHHRLDILVTFSVLYADNIILLCSVSCGTTSTVAALR